VKIKLFLGADEFLRGELWTAGRDTEFCPGKFTWCSERLQDYVKDDLYFKESPAGKTNSCLYLDFGENGTKTDDPKLGFADCGQKKKFTCEVKINLAFWGSNSQLIIFS